MKKGIMGGMVLSLLMAAGSQAAILSHSDSVVFTSDLEPAKNITLPAFDTLGGTRALVDVSVELYHWGSAEPKADNDDTQQGADVNARIIRTWSLSGVGVAGFGNKTVQSPVISLVADDGDLALFDATGPDGHDFGVLGYTSELAGTYYPNENDYDNGGTVSFAVTPLTMVNDLQWDVNPDAWQLEVENPLLEVEVVVNYNWVPVPEPTMLSMLGLGAFALLRKRR